MSRLATLIAATLVAIAAPAAAGSYGVLYNNTKNDGGFNESAMKGVHRFKGETNAELRELVIRTEEESLAAMRNYARAGVTHIMLIGFINEATTATAAAELPGVRFTLIDGLVERPNVRSVLFREDEAGYLVGVAAALASKTAKVGFVGGMPIPPIERFRCGYIQGVKAAKPDVAVLSAYLGKDPSVFRNDTLGEKVGAELLAGQADVVFAAAGFGGNGALRAAAGAGKLGIGVDTNQNGLYPGKVLTSAVKRVDVAAYTAFTDDAAGRWAGGVQRLGLAQNGVGWARDAANEALVANLAAEVDARARDVAAGKLTVVDYASAPECK
jgi:basic membrane protein A